MKRTILTILIILFFVAGGIALFYPDGDTPKDTGPSTDKTEKDKMTEEQSIKYAVIDHLDDLLFGAKADDKIFATYHEFSREGNKLFIWGYISEYYEKNGELKQGAARSGPLVIHLTEDNRIEDHWEPEEGEDYSDSIREKFPQEYQDNVLNFQSEHQDILDDLVRKVSKRAKKELILTQKEPDKTLAIGETDTISLDANRTTGYQWYHNIEEKDIVEVVSDEYEQEEKEEGVVGAGGKRVVEIKGVEEGTTTIEFEYYREWKPEQVEKSKEIKIKVEGEKQAEYDLPRPDLEFITVKDWDVQIFDTPEDIPSEYGIVEGRIECRATSTPETIDDRKYCAQSLSEGAAGKIEEKYTYATVKKDRLITIDLTAIFPQCGNYPEEPRAACQEEENEFEQKELVKSVVESIEN